MSSGPWRHIFKRLAGQHALLSATKWGIGRTIAQVAAKFGAQRAAVGVATTGMTGMTIKYQLEEARDQSSHGLAGDVLSAGDEVEWINAAVVPIWEHLNIGIRRFITDEIEPELQRRVPLVGRYLHFQKLTLGETAPRLGPVAVTRSAHGVDLNVGFEFAGEGIIVFSAGLASIEVANVTVRGAVQVALRPLVDAPNPCGGITISCLDRPSIDLKIRTGSELVPNLYDFIRETVDDVVASTIVVPNGIAVAVPTLGPATDWTALRYPAPRGLLRLEVLMVGGTTVSAPYVTVQVGAATWRTPMARGVGKQAYWNSGIAVQDFSVFSENQSVELRAFCSGTIGPDGLLGRTSVPVLAALLAGNMDVPLQGPDGKATGQWLVVRCSWLKVSDEPPPANPVQSAAAQAGQRAQLASQKSRKEGSPQASKRARSSHGTAGHGDAEALLSMRIDNIDELAPEVRNKYTVRVTVGGRVEETAVGSAPEVLQDSMSDEVLVALASRLAPRLVPEDLADALGVPVEHAEEFVKLEERLRLGLDNAKETTSAWKTTWCMRARAEARALAASQNPQFDQILHVPISGIHGLLVELLCHCEGAGTRTVAHSKVDLNAAVIAGGTLQGPFALQAVGGTGCQLHGSIRLRRLDLQPPPEVPQAKAPEADRFDPIVSLDPLDAAAGWRASMVP